MWLSGARLHRAQRRVAHRWVSIGAGDWNTALVVSHHSCVSMSHGTSALTNEVEGLRNLPWALRHSALAPQTKALGKPCQMPAPGPDKCMQLMHNQKRSPTAAALL